MASMKWSFTDIRGSSEVRGFWKIIAMFAAPQVERARVAHAEDVRRPCTGCSPEVILPGGFMSFNIERPSVDFPQPDSPTMPRTSPL